MDMMKWTSPVFLSKTHQGNRVTKPKIIQEYGNTGLTENVPRVSPWSGFLLPRPPPPECVFPPSLSLAPRDYLPSPFLSPSSSVFPPQQAFPPAATCPICRPKASPISPLQPPQSNPLESRPKNIQEIIKEKPPSSSGEGLQYVSSFIMHLN